MDDIDENYDDYEPTVEQEADYKDEGIGEIGFKESSRLDMSGIGLETTSIGGRKTIEEHLLTSVYTTFTTLLQIKAIVYRESELRGVEAKLKELAKKMLKPYGKRNITAFILGYWCAGEGEIDEFRLSTIIRTIDTIHSTSGLPVEGVDVLRYCRMFTQ